MSTAILESWRKHAAKAYTAGTDERLGEATAAEHYEAQATLWYDGWHYRPATGASHYRITS